MRLNRLFFNTLLTKLTLLVSMVLLTACELKTEMDLEQSQEQMNSYEGCFSCQMFRTVFNAAAQLGDAAYPKMCDVGLSLLALGLFGWILLHVLGLITSLREPNLAQFWIQLFQKLFKGGFVAILIASKERVIEVIDTVMNPIALLFIDLGRMILQSNWVSRVSLTSNISSNLSSGPGFSAEVGQQLEILIYRITLALNVGTLLGKRLMGSGDFSNFWVGLVMVIIFLLMTIFFPLYLLDALFKLALVFMLLPLFLVAWVFKSTSNYLTKAWNIFLGAFAQIMVSCIFVAICIATFEGFANMRGYGVLLAPSAQNVDKMLNGEANRLSLSFLSFLVIAFYMYNLSKGITSVTAYFTGAPSQSVMSAAIGRLKSSIKAVTLTAIAVAAAAVGLAPVAKAAGKEALEETKKAAKPS